MLDNSVSAAWCFADETTAYTEAVLQSATRHGGAVVPAIWPWELVNSLLVAERRGRITAAQRARFLEGLGRLHIEVDPVDEARVRHVLLPLAQRHQLSAYDAAYLDLALRDGLALATNDRRLLLAAHSSGVPRFVG